MSHASSRAGTPKPLEASTVFAADDPLCDQHTDIEAQNIRANLDSSHSRGRASGSGSGNSSYSLPEGSSGSLPSGSPPSYRDSTSTVQWLRSKLPGGHIPTDARYLEEGERGFVMNTPAQPTAPPFSVVDKMLALAANAATEERIAVMNTIPGIVAAMEKAGLEREQVVKRRKEELAR